MDYSTRANTCLYQQSQLPISITNTRIKSFNRTNTGYSCLSKGKGIKGIRYTSIPLYQQSIIIKSLVIPLYELGKVTSIPVLVLTLILSHPSLELDLQELYMSSSIEVGAVYVGLGLRVLTQRIEGSQVKYGIIGNPRRQKQSCNVDVFLGVYSEEVPVEQSA